MAASAEISSQDIEHDANTTLDKGSAIAAAQSRNSSAASVVVAELVDQRYATTQRGLKSRHAQMIALGGAIGTG